MSDHASLFEKKVIESLVNIEAFARKIFGLILIVIALLSLTLSFSAGGPFEAIVTFGRTFAVSIVVAVAATAVGGFLGFLFGIPRLLQRAGAIKENPDPQAEQGAVSVLAPASSQKRFFTSNTSLEEISDWLTKIIIGLGLVQFQSVIDFVYRSAMHSGAYASGMKLRLNAQGLIDIQEPGVATSFYFSLIVGCAVLACLFVYLETRTRLSLLFMDIEFAHDAGVGGQLKSAFARPIVDETAVASNQPRKADPISLPAARPTTEDKLLQALPRDNLRTPTEIAGWASVQARAGNHQAAEDALRDALQQDPENLDILLRLAQVRWLRNNRDGYIDVVIEAVKKSPLTNNAVIAEAKNAQVVALYLPPPKGFEKALVLGAALERASSSMNDPMVHVRVAAAYGQQYAWELKGKRSSEKELEKIRDKALQAVRKALELDSDGRTRNILSGLLDSTELDNDLAAFANDKEFLAVIRPGD